MVVDDHPIWRETLREMLERAGHRVVAEAGDAPTALAGLDEAEPDVVIVDLGLPGMSGDQLVAEMIGRDPGLKVLVLSSSEERADVLRAVKAGAAGYLVKTAAASEVTDAVRAIDGGEIVFPPALAGVVLAELRRLAAEETGMRIAAAHGSMLMREGIARVLTELGFEVAGTVSTLDEMVSLLSTRTCDAIVSDASLIASSAAVDRVRRDHPDLPILLIGDTPDLTLATNSPRVGLLMDRRVSEPEQLREALTRLATGGTVIDPDMVGSMVGGQRGRLGLSPRECEVLALMAEGRSNGAISEQLFLTPKTVEAHVRSIFTKLGLEATQADHRRVLAVVAFLRSNAS